MKRITQKTLNSVATTINRVTNSPLTQFTKMPRPKGLCVTYTSNIGHYYVDYTYGTACLFRIQTLGGGVKVVINLCSKQELYHRMHSFISGYNAKTLDNSLNCVILHNSK